MILPCVRAIIIIIILPCGTNQWLEGCKLVNTPKQGSSEYNAVMLNHMQHSDFPLVLYVVTQALVQ